MRISFLVPSLHFGGVERWALTLCRHLQHVHVDSIISFGEANHAEIEQEAKRHARVFTLPIRLDDNRKRWWVTGEARAMMAEAIRYTDAILVSAGGELEHFEDQLAKVARSVVSHVDPIWAGQAWKVRREARFATHCVAVSKAAAKCFEYENVTVLENGAELDRLAPTADLRTNWGIPKDGKIAL